MELKKLQEQWNSFPEISMEERPVLSSDLEKIVVRNPLSDAFYLRKKILARILTISALWLLTGWQLRVQWFSGGRDLPQLIALFCLLSYSIYFHLRLLFFSDYPTLLSLPLVTFLGKLETILDKYILSFKFISWIAGFFVLAGIEFAVYHFNPDAYNSLSRNDVYKWLILIIFSVSLDILLLKYLIPRYKRLLLSVRRYREGIQTKAQNK